MLTYEEIDAASSAGAKAAEVGSPAADCPYPEHSLPAFFWLTGWMNTDNRRVILEAGAIMQWAVDSLSSVEELLNHYDRENLPLTEILEKIKLVRQKIEEKL